MKVAIARHSIRGLHGQRAIASVHAVTGECVAWTGITNTRQEGNHLQWPSSVVCSQEEHRDGAWPSGVLPRKRAGEWGSPKSSSK